MKEQLARVCGNCKHFTSDGLRFPDGHDWNYDYCESLKRRTQAFHEVKGNCFQALRVCKALGGEA